MDGAEYRWKLDDIALGSFMANYAPLPEHLRKKRGKAGVADVADDGDVVMDLEKDPDAAGADEEIGVEDEDLLQPDLSDETLLSRARRVIPAATSNDGTRRVRRRLVKKDSQVDSQKGLSGGVDTTFEDNALNVPVSI